MVQLLRRTLPHRLYFQLEQTVVRDIRDGEARDKDATIEFIVRTQMAPTKVVETVNKIYFISEI
jgi:hypothetical protein